MSCEHQHTVEDISCGDLVCTDCGLVLDKIYLPTTKDKAPPRKERIIPDSCIDLLVEDMCNKCHIENENIKSLASKKWQNMKRIYKKNVCQESSILISIYTALIESQVPRPLNHLCAQTNITSKKVWNYLKANDTFYKPSLMCEYFLHVMNLPFKHLEEIRKMVEKLETRYVFSQKTLIASCAYIYLRNQANISKKMKISISRLAKQLGISSMAMYRCVQKIERIETQD